jgi:2-polyprenyl-3-methyl-5-hydroxy-6-metoxy-1,4-benzoquinol methylase
MSENNSCPICGQETLSPTEHQFQVADILHNWEKSTQVRFNSSVWDFYRDKSTTLYHCNNCDFSIYQPVLAGIEDFYTDIMTKGGMTYVVDKWEFKQAIADIQKLTAKNVLDIGCGSGYFLDKVKAELPYIERYGYELSGDVAAIAKSKGHSIYTGEFSHTLFGDKKFDIISCFQVLEHVENPDQVIQEMKYLLSPQGKLLISVPDMDGPVGSYFSFVMTNLPPHHVSWWNERVFNLGFQRYGLEVIETRLEPLPNYLWESYLPAIVGDKLLAGKFIARVLRKLKLIPLLARISQLIGIHEISFLRGHSIYVTLQESERDEER